MFLSMDSKGFFCKFVDHIVVFVIGMTFDLTKFDVYLFFCLLIKIAVCDRARFIGFPVSVAPARDSLIIMVYNNSCLLYTSDAADEL